MIRIDLLPKEERKRRAPMAAKGAARGARAPRPSVKLKVPVGIDTVLVAIVLLVILGIMYVVFTGQKREIARLGDEIAAMQTELVRLKEAVQLVKDLEAKEQAIKVKLDVIGKLNKDRFLRAHMLDDLSNLLPDNSWLTSVVERMPSVTIEGVAFSNFTVADFMRKLGTSNYFQDVDLSVLSKDKVGGRDLMKFRLTANLVSYTPPVTPVPPQAPAPADTSKKDQG
jgi:type IV pilus assembly protein PilN